MTASRDVVDRLADAGVRLTSDSALRTVARLLAASVTATAVLQALNRMGVI